MTIGIWKKGHAAPLVNQQQSMAAMPPARLASPRPAPHSPPRQIRPVLLKNIVTRENVMKLVRYGPAGREKPGIVDSEGKIRDLSRIVKDIDAEALSPKGLAKIKKANINRLKAVPGKPRLGPCVAGTRHFIAIGLNFSDHAKETGSEIPKEPIIFDKAATCISGPNDNVVIPLLSPDLMLTYRSDVQGVTYSACCNLVVDHISRTG